MKEDTSVLQDLHWDGELHQYWSQAVLLKNALQISLKGRPTSNQGPIPLARIASYPLP
jgi:hypothetical protein